jgi:hypothetical protein
VTFLKNSGFYILKNIPPPPGREGKNISRSHLGEKIWEREEKKVENVREQGKRGKKKEERGKEKRSKRVKYLKNRGELRQKEHDRRWKTTCRKRGEKYHFWKKEGK